MALPTFCSNDPSAASLHPPSSDLPCASGALFPGRRGLEGREFLGIL